MTPDQIAIRTAAIESLEQGRQLLETVDPADYSAPLGSARGSSIGAHYRHSLEHFRLLVDGLASHQVDYDLRSRDRAIETDPTAALAETTALAATISLLEDLDRDLAVTCQVSRGGDPSPTAPSSVGRELMFCVAHATHHHALIRVLAESDGLRLSQEFGVAPSTARHAAALASA